MFKDVFSPTPTTTSLTIKSLKPGSLMLTAYKPELKSGMENEPELSVAVVRCSPVFLFRDVMLAPAIGASCWSRTPPMI